MQQPTRTKKDFDRSGSTMKHIRFEDPLLAQIESIAGNGNFSAWVKKSCREKLRRLGIEPQG
ncbi:DUF3950 domain-containing protein [Salmonella enterica subsp. enterica serovar Kottbus]|nr:DUF3950 domain-containing protein [Salmonella enterica subsp. enterica serovar Newport]EBY2753783.1 DUF3950 domain-containing protein [Salmonella enterica subsp. enterica serovar Kottbus]EHN5888407.1 DUF3950 domain-containing protein [Salmonella enterica subsp. enterica serovar Newport]